MHLYMHPLRWSCRHWSLLVLLSCSLGSAAGFAGSLPLVRGRVGRRVQAPHVVLAQAGEGNTRVLDALEFIIGTTFSSRLYIGSPQLHLSVPVPPPGSYPEFVPTWVRLPRSVYDLVDRGVEKGWIKKAGADTIFQIKYGVLRGEVIAGFHAPACHCHNLFIVSTYTPHMYTHVCYCICAESMPGLYSLPPPAGMDYPAKRPCMVVLTLADLRLRQVNVLPDETCEPCELEKRQRLELDAARDLVNIGERKSMTNARAHTNTHTHKHTTHAAHAHTCSDSECPCLSQVRLRGLDAPTLDMLLLYLRC